MVLNSPDKYTKAFENIAALKDEWEIKYLIDLGDMVETYADPNDYEWDLVVDAHDMLQTAGLKYAIAVGNHECTAAHKATPNSPHR